MKHSASSLGLFLALIAPHRGRDPRLRIGVPLLSLLPGSFRYVVIQNAIA